MEHQNKKLEQLELERSASLISSKKQIYNEIRYQQGFCSLDVEPRKRQKTGQKPAENASKLVQKPLVPMLFPILEAHLPVGKNQPKGFKWKDFCTK